METLTYENLIDAGACDEAEQFARVYPNGLPLTAESIEAAMMRFPNGIDFILPRLPRELQRPLQDAIDSRMENARRRIVAVVLSDAAPEIMAALPKDRRDNPHADDHRYTMDRLTESFRTGIGAEITPEHLEAARRRLSEPDPDDPSLLVNIFGREALLMVEREPTAGVGVEYTMTDRAPRGRPRAGARHFIEQLRSVNLTPAEATELHVAIEARVRPLRGDDYPPTRSGAAQFFSPQFSARELAILMDVINDRDRPQDPLTPS